MILGLGCIAHDLILVTATPWESGKGRVVKSDRRFGGNVRNALATVAALEYPAGYLGTIGTSELADQAVEDLGDYDIDTRFVEREDGADPVVSRITVTAGGERYVAFDDAPLATTPLPSEATVHRALGAATALMVDACVAPPGSLQVVEQARALGVPVIVDAERDASPTVLALLEAADHLVIPRGFGAEITGAASPADIAAALWNGTRAVIVLTDGAAGSYAFASASSSAHVPAFAVDAVDTTGCGDAFHGAYAWALISGFDLVDRVTIASAAAAALASLPTGSRRVVTRSSIAQHAPRVGLG